jgi:hypothetical protein
MKMQALMTPQKAVKTSNMAMILYSNGRKLTARGNTQSKKFRRRPKVSNWNDDF